MKILSVANEIKKDLETSGYKLKRATEDGYCIADRTAIYKQGNFQRYINVTRSVGDKIIKGTTKKELPYVAGALGLLIPFPLVSPILMGLGFLFSYGSFNSDNKSEPHKLNQYR